MKVFAFVLLFAAAVSDEQIAYLMARSAGLKNAVARVDASENPWLVHLRIAVSTSGYLESCAGSIIDPRWVLTTASCLVDARFVWVRYGVVDAFRPELVTETGSVRINQFYSPGSGDNNIGLVGLNRNVLNPASPNIAPVRRLANYNDLPSESSKFCAFGENEEGDPGQHLNCFNVNLSEQGGLYWNAKSDEGKASKYDLGAPVVEDGVQLGILVKPAEGDSAGVFLSPYSYLNWIEIQANIDLPRD